MARAEWDVETGLSPDQVRAALLDFSDDRPKVWAGLEPSLYKVHWVRETEAEVQEGTKLAGLKIWGREHYDWSDPNRIRWTVTESNFSKVGSYIEAVLTARVDGGTHVHLSWYREGTTLVGKFVVMAIALTKGKPIADSMKRAFDDLEKQ